MDSEGSFQYCLDTEDLEGVRECIKKGIDVNNIVKHMVLYPLHISSIRGSTEICRLLLESKANPNPPRTIAPPLVQAFAHGKYSDRQESYTRIAKMLLYAGAKDETQDWTNYPIARTLLQSKTSCRLALGAVYLVLKKHTRQSKDMTNLIMNTVWDIRFEFTKDL